MNEAATAAISDFAELVIAYAAKENDEELLFEAESDTVGLLTNADGTRQARLTLLDDGFIEATFDSAWDARKRTVWEGAAWDYIAEEIADEF